jgi:hypothetical protein
MPNQNPQPVTPNDPQASDQPMIQQEYAPPAPDTSSLPAGNYNGVATQDRLQKAAFHATTDLEAQQAADNSHHALIGRSVKALFGSLNNSQTTYSTDPSTGQVTEQQVPQKPGSFFRNLIGGMLLGAAAGSQGTVDKEGKVTGGGGFLGGLGRGGSAVMQARQQQNDSSFKRAQEQLKAQMEAQKQSEEERYHAALTAHENIQTAEILHNQHTADETSVRTHNAAVRAYEDNLIASGAQPVQLSINGNMSDTVDGTTFQAAYIKDPSIARAATPGYQRHFLSTTDLSELHYEGGSWVDDSGKPVNLGKSMSIKAYDVPTATMKTPVQTSGKDINAARRQRIVDPSKTYPVSPEAMSGLYTIGAKEENEKARTAATNSRADKANKLNQQTSQIEAKRAAAKAKANLTYWSRINSNPLAADDEKTGEKGTASRERDEALKAADDAYNTEMGVLRGTDSQPNVLPKKGETQVTQGYTYIFDGKRWVKGKPVVNQ